MVETARHRIDGYRIVAPIGVGGSASVYRAVHESTGDQVAIKVLADNHSLVPRLRRRFLDQVALLAAIDSPAVARIFQHGETESGQPYLVLELADRGDLRHRLEELRARGLAPGVEDVEVLARHLAASLGALHQAGIVHRDVSPGNVLIAGARPDDKTPGGDRDGTIILGAAERFLLADLGLAKDLAHRSGLTVGAGTRGFAAPEQRDVVTVVDHRADVYGATALIRWFVEDTALAEQLTRFFNTGLATDPDDRPATMTGWLAQLQAALDGHRRRLPGTGPRLRWVRWLLAMTIVAAIVGGGLLLSGAMDDVITRTDGEDDTALGGEPVPAAPDAAADEPALVVADAQATGPDPAVDDQADTGGGPTAASTSEGEPTDQASPSSTAPVEVETATTTTSSAETTATTAPAEITITTVPADGGAATTQAPATTTDQVPAATNDPFARSPRASLDQPADGATVSGPLEVAGSATYVAGVEEVTLTIHLVDTDLYWHDDLGRLADGFIRNPVVVSPVGGTAVTWSYTVPADRLAPGTYVVRVWARGVDGRGDPVSAIHRITVPA
ncbi:MAG: protein kinase [Actinomycetota bacterium]